MSVYTVELSSDVLQLGCPDGAVRLQVGHSGPPSQHVCTIPRSLLLVLTYNNTYTFI
ncbi:hypothetical protein DPMN_090687 [Dreissena polymorpha]|uniref:Uncharacterized protein n=1 Tax=Dreissena polymorpha TaxID=45954 RepID=A0A9D4QZA3_DREPO|nr:hypothetical protein DPMN_090687 [Dreissena polymorpha]